MLFVFTSSAFYRYLSLARQVPGAPARTVTDRQTDRHTDTHDDYYNLAPSRARLMTLECDHWLCPSRGLGVLHSPVDCHLFNYLVLHTQSLMCPLESLLSPEYAQPQLCCAWVEV